jgi:hypothetical protein
MAQFMFVYYGGKKPDTPEEGAAMMQKWHAWIAGLGEAMVNPGTPVGMSKTVSADGVADDGGANPVNGFSIIEAESMEAVLEIAKGCPFLDMETATIEVAEMMSM